MTRGLVLSLFPGIDILGRGFEEEGWCVVRGPDLLWGGDIRRFHPPAGPWAGVIGGPPCQAFSSFRHLVEANEYRVAANLIPEFERCVVEASPSWFLMENVPAAPPPTVNGYDICERILDNHWLGETAQGRKRRFSLGTPKGIAFHITTPALVPIERASTVCANSGGGRPNAKRNSAYGSGAERLAAEIRLQGLPEGFLDGSPFTAAGKQKTVGNAVPLPMARAVAKAVGKALEKEL